MKKTTNKCIVLFYSIYNLQRNLYAKTCNPTTTVTLYSKRLTLSATDTENRGKVKNAQHPRRQIMPEKQRNLSLLPWEEAPILHTLQRGWGEVKKVGRRKNE